MKRLAIISALVALGIVLNGCGGEVNTKAPVWNPTPVTLPSGLAYNDYQVGYGPAPEIGDYVSIHYTAFLYDDGTKIDDTLITGEAASFYIGEGRVIKGWDEGVISMKLGGKRRLIVPPDLAYGSAGKPPIVPPNATIVFYVELADFRPMSTTSAGVRYEDLVVGTGALAEQGNNARVHYTGRLVDGTMFDSSAERGPFQFQIGAGQVISGWDYGLEGMRVGGKRKLVLSPDFGYGAEGSPPTIPPDAWLIFEIELIHTEPMDPA